MCKFFFVLSFFPEEKNDKAFHSTMLATMKMLLRGMFPFLQNPITMCECMQSSHISCTPLKMYRPNRSLKKSSLCKT